MPADAFRWQAFFQRCQDAVFLLNGRRTVLFVNHAWEAMTGVSRAQARGLVCRRRRDPRPDSLEILQHALAPPPEALAGKPARIRRLIPGASAGPRWWDISFFPLWGEQGLRGILGRISPVTPVETPTLPLLPERLVSLRERLRQSFQVEALESELPAMRRVAEQVRLASQTRTPVLLLGEAGTGKEWIARTIHQESPGRELSFAALDCRRLPAMAVEAVLFGPADANAPAFGMVYLKNPVALPRELQARVLDLLAAAPEGGVRVSAGCEGDPAAEVQAGRLLAELHFALSTLTLSVPPLRERLAELPALVERMLRRLQDEDGRPGKRLSADALEVLRAHAWPGNLAELHTVLAEAAARAGGEEIQAAELPFYLRNPGPPPERTLPLDTLLEQVERRLILLALRKAGNNKTRAAELLAIWRPRLLRRMEALGIEEEGMKDEG